MEKLASSFVTVAVLSSMWIERGYSTYSVESFEYHVNKKWDAGSHNYSDALSKAILFFEGQRSGKLPTDQRMTWRRDSALFDGSFDSVDLAGGYYDAGDNLKFGFPMAFTATMLSWSVLEFGGLMGGEVGNAKTAIRWVSDYLLKATAHQGTIYVQVGDPNNDRKCWERPEDMDTARTVYKIDAQHPGSDVAAETAAALAAASLVFRNSDSSYSSKLVLAAVKAFDFADQHRGAYSDSLQSSVCPFYCSYSGYQDELLWGAMWLYKATRDLKYLNFVQANGQKLGAYGSINSFGWDNKHIGTRLLASKEFLLRKAETLKDYKGLADNYICSLLPGSGSQYTPGGLLYVLPGSNLQYVTSASFILLTYAKYLKSSKQVAYCGQTTLTPTKLRAMAKRQVDYILGDNPGSMSYMVGYGSKYPQRIHHRASSLPSVGEHPEAMGCEEGFQYLSSSSSNPNILVGAVVGGPDNNDGFSDDRNSYAQAEPTTYINAPLVGSLAYLAHSTGS